MSINSLATNSNIIQIPPNYLVNCVETIHRTDPINLIPP